ncbi:hypothetical protein ACW23B_29195 [Streptomyces albidoflavus]
MLDTPQAVLDALRENDGRPHGLHRTVTAELAEAAEAFDDPALLVTALLELMAAYEFTGEHRKSPVVFARLLKLHDRPMLSRRARPPGQLADVGDDIISQVPDMRSPRPRLGRPDA